MNGAAMSKVRTFYEALAVCLNLISVVMLQGCGSSGHSEPA